MGDRVVFTAQRRERVPALEGNGRVVQRTDGTPRQRTIRTPRRTQGVLESFAHDPGGELVLQVRTDRLGRLAERVVHIPATADVLDHGYAMTTTVAQGRSWDTTYRVLTASRLTGRQQEYPAATRRLSQSLLFGDLRSVYAEAEGEIGVREDAILKYGVSQRPCKSIDAEPAPARHRPRGPLPAPPGGPRWTPRCRSRPSAQRIPRLSRLGFDHLQRYLTDRYVEQRASLTAISRELSACSREPW
ncbi:MAG: hypothetical protein WCB85_08215 [Candidatus Dormiibacterota bacterium]